MSASIKINGEERTVQSKFVSELLSELEIDKDTVAVELNSEIVVRSSQSETTLQDGDVVEILECVAGG